MLSSSTMAQPIQKIPLSFLQRQELKPALCGCEVVQWLLMALLSVRFVWTSLSNVILQLCFHLPDRWILSFGIQCFRAPYSPRQSWSFPCVLEECGGTPHCLALLHPHRVSGFLCHSSDPRPWSLLSFSSYLACSVLANPAATLIGATACSLFF